MTKKENKSLYDLLIDNRYIEKDEEVVLKRGYAAVLKENSVRYVINPHISDYKKLSKSVYSALKDAFRLYKKGIIGSAYIIAGTEEKAEKIRAVKKDMEERYSYVGTDAGFYETPLLGKMQEFSIKRVSVVTYFV